MRYFSALFIILILTGCLFSADLNVPDKYQTIQAAVDAATNGDTIYVEPGVYKGKIDFGTKDLSLISTEPNQPELTILTFDKADDWPDGEYRYIVKLPTEHPNDCKIKGFTFKNITHNYSSSRIYTFAILCSETNSETNIENCIFDSFSCPFVNHNGVVKNSIFYFKTEEHYDQFDSELRNCLLINAEYQVGGLTYNSIILNLIPLISESPDYFGCCFSNGTSVENSTNFIGNPRFSTLFENDYHLRLRSPCIDAGVNSYVDANMMYDIEGHDRKIDDPIARDRGTSESPIVDIGPYEHNYGIQRMGLSKYHLNYLIQNKGDMITKSAKIGCYGKESFDWTIEEDYTWLEFSPTSGTATSNPSTISVTADSTGLNGGNYSALVKFTSDGVPKDKKMLVTLTVGGIINVPEDFPTIQAAVDNANNGDTIYVHEKDQFLNADPPAITEYADIDFKGKAVTIKSMPEVFDRIIITKGGNDYDDKSCVRFLNGETRNSVLDGFIITGGTGEDLQPTESFDLPNYNYNYPPLYGGGILCINSSPAIKNCIIENNGDKGDFSDYPANNNEDEITGYGGGIAIFKNSSPLFKNCRITDNRAQYGAGVFVRSLAPEYCRPEFVNCTIANNETVTNESSRTNPDKDYCWLKYQVDAKNCPVSIKNSIVKQTLFPYKYKTHTYQYPEGDIIITFGNSYDILLPDTGLIEYSCVGKVQEYDSSKSNPYNYPAPDINRLNGNISAAPEFKGLKAKIDMDMVPGSEFTYDYHLKNDSPCIDKGSSDIDIPLDGDKQPRIMIYSVDMGFDEVEPYVKVNAPRGNEKFTSGSIHKIKWQKNFQRPVDIFLSKDGGDNWEVKAENITGNNYQWSVPDLLYSNDCMIQVEPAEGYDELVIVKSGKFSVYPDSPDPDANVYWQGENSGSNRNSSNQQTGPEVGCIEWIFEADGPIYSSIAIGADDNIHTATENGILYTLNKEGNLVWSYDTNSVLLSSPSVGKDGTVYVGSQEGTLLAVSKDGDLRWKFSTEGMIPSCPAVDENGNIYFGSEDGYLYSLMRDGTLRWKFAPDAGNRIHNAIMMSPTIDGNSVYVGGLYDPNLYALDTETGEVKWNCCFVRDYDPAYPGMPVVKGWPYASPVIADDTIYMTLMYDTYLYAVDSNDGTIKWSTDLADEEPGFYEPLVSEYGEYYPLGASGLAEPLVGKDGTVYANLDDPYLRAIEPNGNMKWTKRLGMEGSFYMTIDKKDHIYAACDDGMVYVLDKTGNEISNLRRKNAVQYPVIDKTGDLLVTDTDSRILSVSDNSCIRKELHKPFEINGKGKLNLQDYIIFADNYLEDIDDRSAGYRGNVTYLKGDLNKDFYVDFEDFKIIVKNWLN